jgi:leucyl aminopeptidase
MDVTLRRSSLAARACGLLAVGVAEGSARLSGAALALDRATKGAVTRTLAAGDFKGRASDVALVYPEGLKAKRVLLVGLGPAAKLDEKRIRLAAATASRRARELGAGSLALALHTAATLDDATAQAAAEGAVLGHHRYAAYKSDAKSALTRIELLTESAAPRGVAAAVRAGAIRGEAVCLARDLASTPGQDLTPIQLAARAKDVAKRAGAKLTVFDVAAMERLGMGCVLAVGRGSVNPPRFIVLDRPADAAPRGKKPHTIVIIGKGVTFDTGGYSLKPRDGMGKMKYDMSGSAAVLGLFASLPALGKLPVRVVGLIPSAENMVSDAAYKPGDVIRAIDGTTIEVTNTDAEGRLLLADALGYAKRLSPETVIDLATLTGAMAIALGRHAAGLYSRDDLLASELQDAGEATGERLWRMPLWDEFRTEMRSEVADLVNSDEKSEGGSNKAAAFLEHFAGDMHWAHLDIASTAWTYAERPDASRGPNAFGVRLLTRWLEMRVRR